MMTVDLVLVANTFWLTLSQLQVLNLENNQFLALAYGTLDQLFNPNGI